jgi:hypothetical protein
MIGFVVGLCIEGLVFGVVLRAVLPGAQNWTIGQTLGTGVLGWLVLGFVLRAIFGLLVGLLLPLAIIGGTAGLLARRRGGELPPGGGRR